MRMSPSTHPYTCARRVRVLPHGLRTVPRGVVAKTQEPLGVTTNHRPRRRSGRARVIGGASRPCRPHRAWEAEAREPKAPRPLLQLHRRQLQPEPCRERGGVRVELGLHPPPELHPRQAGRGADGPRCAWSPRPPARSGRGAALVAPPPANAAAPATSTRHPPRPASPSATAAAPRPGGSGGATPYAIASKAGASGGGGGARGPAAPRSAGRARAPSLCPAAPAASAAAQAPCIVIHCTDHRCAPPTTGPTTPPAAAAGAAGGAAHGKG